MGFRELVRLGGIIQTFRWSRVLSEPTGYHSWEDIPAYVHQICFGKNFSQNLPFSYLCLGLNGKGMTDTHTMERQNVWCFYWQVLQSSGSTGDSSGKSPKWLLSACGTLMTERLMKSPKGVHNLIKGVLDIGPANSAQNQQKSQCDLKKVQIITAIVSNPTTSGGKCFLVISG